jgi:predicted GH43/DUF377 family glycosyl hydrolase
MAALKTKIKSKKALPKTKVKTTVKKTPAKKIVKIVKKIQSKVKTKIKLKPIGLTRYKQNPILAPRDYDWETKASFNPTAFLGTDKIHIIYRAIGEDDSSALGYAATVDGSKITERPPYYIYRRFNPSLIDFKKEPINYMSGGGWNGGCEDPRVTRIGDMVYLIYTAFDGWGSVRLALTSIPLKDFEEKHFNWKTPVLISQPNEVNKNWALFPEKINGKFALLHSISPDILIDYFTDLNELDGNKFIDSIHSWSAEWNKREPGIRGIGPAPIKTTAGWLILYHKMEQRDPDRYKLWAMLLDLKDPTKVLYKSPSAILEPDEWYENEGYKWGVVYSCGAVVKDGTLFVYYGGADKVACVATIELDELLEDLKKHKVAKLKKAKLAI